MPEPPRFDPGEATGAALRTLKEEFKEEKAAWRDDMEIYKLSLAQQQRIQKGLQLVDQAMLISVDMRLQQLMDRLETPYDRLRFLMRRFSHSQSHKMEVMIKWRERHIKGPEPGQDVLQWLDDWDLQREEVLSLGIEPDNLHPALFLQAVKDVMPVWWDARFQQVVIQGQPTSMATLLDSFRTTYIETRKARQDEDDYIPPSRPAFHTEFIEFKDRKKCPCGGPHPAVRCWYLNERLRPDDWKEATHRQAKIKKAFEREPEWEAWIERQMEQRAETANLAMTTWL
ncbi:hypothetical protein N7486_005803 [Penicillium sp. IBT 16267x]|nr:hypothetical protein N7486_005803 [Penicillium sp. IBT 16267x]